MSESFSRPLAAFLWRRHRAAVFAAACVPVLIGLAAGAVYEETEGKRDLLRKLLEAFPKLRRATDSDTLDFLSPAGFFNIAFRHPLTFLAAALAAGAPALTTPAVDRGRGVLDLLLAAPLGRGALVRTSAIVVLRASAIVGCAPWLGAIAGAAAAGKLGEVPMLRYGVAAVHAAAFTAALGGAALVIAVGARDGAAATARFAAFFIATMLLDAFSMLWERGAFLRRLSLAGYCRASEIVAGGEIPAFGWATLLVVFVGGAAYAAAAAERRSRA